MKRRLDQKGAVNGAAVIVALLGLSTLALGGLAIWALLQFNTAQATVDQQKAAAASEARALQKAEDEKEFTERLKNPYRTYEAPTVFGAFSLKFPKSWNVYAEESSTGSTPIDLYMHPGIVRVSQGADNTYAFRMQLLNSLYTNEVSSYQRSAEKGDLKATSVKVSGIAGTRYDGHISRAHEGSLVLVPTRDKTLVMWTESNEYLEDFNKIIEQVSVSR